MSERIKLYSLKQKLNQSLTDFLFAILQFPNCIRRRSPQELFFQGLLSDTTKHFFGWEFASATQKSKLVSLNDAIKLTKLQRLLLLIKSLQMFRPKWCMSRVPDSLIDVTGGGSTRSTAMPDVRKR